MSARQQNREFVLLLSHRNTDLTMIYEWKYFMRVEVPQVSTKLRTATLKQIRRAISLYPHQPLLQVGIAQLQERRLRLTTSDLGEREKWSMCPMFQLFGGRPKVLYLSCLTQGTDRKPAYFGCLVAAACYWRARDFSVPQTDTRGSKRWWAPEKETSKPP